MAEDGLERGGGGAVVEEGAAETQSPERGRADLACQGGGLRDAVSGGYVVQQQIGKERYRAAVEDRVGVLPGEQDGDMTAGASYGGEDGFAAEG